MSKDFGADILKGGKDALNSARYFVPENSSDYLGDFQVGGGVSLPASMGFKDTLSAGVGIKIPPVLGCGGLNAAASIKNAFSPETIKKSANKIMGFARQALTSVISSAPLYAMATLCSTCYEVLTHDIGVSLDGFLEAQIPSCQEMQKIISEENKDAYDKGKDWNPSARASGMASKIWDRQVEASAKAKAMVSWAGKDHVWDSTDDEQIKATNDAKGAGLDSVNMQGVEEKCGGTDQPECDTAKIITGLAMASLKLEDTYTDMHFALGVDPKQRITAEQLLPLIEKLLGVTKGYANQPPTVIPPTEYGTLVDEERSEIHKKFTRILSQINAANNANKVATREDILQLAYATGLSSFNPRVITLLAEGFRNQYPETPMDYQNLVYAMAKHKALISYLAVYRILKAVSAMPILEKNKVLEGFVAQASGIFRSQFESSSKLIERVESTRYSIDAQFHQIIKQDEERKRLKEPGSQ